jgi:hypothetical protein
VDSALREPQNTPHSHTTPRASKGECV